MDHLDKLKVYTQTVETLKQALSSLRTIHNTLVEDTPSLLPSSSISLVKKLENELSEYLIEEVYVY